MSPMKLTRPRVTLAIGAALALGVVACGGQGAEDEGPIRVGASLPLTGQFSIPGAKHRDGYEYCAKVINDRGGLMGRQVELMVRDNRSDTETAVSQHERFINVDDVDLMFGTFSSLLTFPTSTVTERAQMVLPVPSGAALEIWERGYQHLFYFQQDAAEYIGKSPINALVDYRDQGVISDEDFPKTAAVVHADDFFANGIAAGLLGGSVEVPGQDPVSLEPGFLAEAGIEPVLTEQWPEGFNNWISLANKIRSSEAELLLAGTASPDEAINLANALKTVNYRPKVIYMSQGTQSEFQENLGDTANGIMAHSSWHPSAEWEGVLAGQPISNADFVEGFEQEYDRTPDEDEAIPFALCQGMAQAVEATEGTDQQELREWFASRTEAEPVETILGPFHWDERGLPVGRDFLMTQWQDGELNFVYPRDEFPGVSEIVYPKPAW